jgi:hypothetical protein
MGIKPRGGGGGGGRGHSHKGPRAAADSGGASESAYVSPLEKLRARQARRLAKKHGPAHDAAAKGAGSSGKARDGPTATGHEFVVEHKVGAETRFAVRESTMLSDARTDGSGCVLECPGVWGYEHANANKADEDVSVSMSMHV